MSDIQVIKLAREFRKIDRKFDKTYKEVDSLINEGYMPEEALMLAGISGYDIN